MLSSLELHDLLQQRQHTGLVQRQRHRHAIHRHSVAQVGVGGPQTLQNDGDPHPPPCLQALCLTACSKSPRKQYLYFNPKINQLIYLKLLIKFDCSQV